MGETSAPQWCGFTGCSMFSTIPRLGACLLLAAGLPAVQPAAAGAQSPNAVAGLPSEMPETFTPRVDTFDYLERQVMIPMRDGVKLKTVILIPRGAHAAPILLTRTPYGATERIEKGASAHLGALIDSTDVADDAVVNGGYIRVLQDIRGKHGSEGDYVMTRPLHGPLNSTAVDHSTDTYDTIDWLVKNLPESNGKVGILGISYDGFTSLMALVNPHPALRAAVPINAMVDGWRGDDWFHNGAFRQDSLVYFHDQQATRNSDVHWWSNHYDDYDTWLAAGSAGDMAKLHGLDQVGFSAKVIAIPPTIPSGRIRHSTRSSASKASPFRPCWCTACGIRRTSTAISPSTSRSRRITPIKPTCIWCLGRGFTTSSVSKAIASATSNGAATRRPTFACTCCGPFSTIS
jgi:hypothetical protein